ncbi:MAG: proton-conducting transporter membrane subunit, partial [Rhizobiaceae bacterium]|nr:proton-conducting transporter membrane subunit [Rhizobiaceae bacterium]
SIIHLFNHGVTKGALFMVTGAYVMRKGSSFCDNLAGLGKRMPITSAAFVISGLSLIGVPGTAGFISKWLLVNSALEKDWWWMAILIVGSSLLAIIYVWKIVELLYFKEAPDDEQIEEAPYSMLIPMWVLAAVCVISGVDTDLTYAAAKAAADGLLGAGVAQ